MGFETYRFLSWGNALMNPGVRIEFDKGLVKLSAEAFRRLDSPRNVLLAYDREERNLAVTPCRSTEPGARKVSGDHSISCKQIFRYFAINYRGTISYKPAYDVFHDMPRLIVNLNDPVVIPDQKGK